MPAMDQRLASGAPCALLLFDVDHFKETNDRFGHGIGDLLLEKLATTVTNLLPEEALLARIGGEEFACCCRWPHWQRQSNGPSVSA